MLSGKRISELAATPGAKKIAVENFLGTCGGSTLHDALANLQQDTRLYNWNEATVKAIRTGIIEMHEESPIDWFNKQADKHPSIGFFPKRGIWYAEIVVGNINEEPPTHKRIIGNGVTVEQAIRDCFERAQ